MDITAKDGQNTAYITPKSVNTYHRENNDCPGITITATDSRGDKTYIYLSYEQAVELNQDVQVIVAPN
jgi:hypothetical protein